ncbi:MAG: ATP-binding cassette domain-containing protein [Clostridiales bacterium]|jgi:D-methionine transport system ATP-binding protein|nr:ATP-binding cassette domain-containing protein [Clostridiales bacterium]
MIRLNDINKTYETANGPLRAVNSVTVNISAGEIFGFIGFSGAGKSTLLRCINLLEKPDSGQVFVDGEDFTRLQKKELLKRRQKIGMIFQHFNLIQNATVYQNVAFPLEIAGLDKKLRRERILHSLETVDLLEKETAYPVKLSGGQKQRVAIARAIVTNPKILLCDEPTSALDPQTTQSILHYLKRINQEFGITIVLVTHEMEAARKICNRVSVMDGGKVVETLNMSESIPEPQSELAKFLFVNGGGI